MTSKRDRDRARERGRKAIEETIFKTETCTKLLTMLHELRDQDITLDYRQDWLIRLKESRAWLTTAINDLTGNESIVTTSTDPCAECGTPMPQRPGSGRRRTYCSDRCRQRAHRRRKE